MDGATGLSTSIYEFKCVHEEWMGDRAVYRPIYVYTFTERFVCRALDVDVDGMGLQSRKLSGVV